MSFFKKPGRILILIMIVLAVVCPYRVHMYKTKEAALGSLYYVRTRD